MAAVYLGLWFAERLSRPIGRLAFAAQKVREGELNIQVKEPKGDDDLALLTRGFNRMTQEVRRKQSALTTAKEESEARRLFSEAVLLGVSAGVVYGSLHARHSGDQPLLGQRVIDGSRQ